MDDDEDDMFAALVRVGRQDTPATAPTKAPAKAPAPAPASARCDG